MILRDSPMIKKGAFDHLKGKKLGEVMQGIKTVQGRHGDKVSKTNLARMGAMRDLHSGKLVIPIGGQIVIEGPVPDANVRKPTILDDFGIKPKG